MYYETMFEDTTFPILFGITETFELHYICSSNYGWIIFVITVTNILKRFK